MTNYPQMVIAGVQNFLGKGYKGWQFYASPMSCTLSLFDFDFPDLKDVNVQRTPEYQGSFAFGEDKSQYFESLSTNISLGGAYAGFSAEVKANFDDDVLNKADHQFATAHHCLSYYRLSVGDSAQLNPDVKSALDTWPPSKLFETYGTHYLNSFYLGGRVSYTSCVDTSEVTQNFDFKATADAAFNAFLTPGKGGGETIAKSDLDQVASNKTIRVVGGDPALGQQVATGTGQDVPATYDKWSASVPNYVSIADFDQGGLVPLYELTTGSRRAQLQEAWQSYMRGRTDPNLLTGDVVRYGDEFYLKDQDGHYVVAAGTMQGEVNFWNFPTVALEGRVPLSFVVGAVGDVVRAGEITQLRTNEPNRDPPGPFPLFGSTMAVAASVPIMYVPAGAPTGGEADWTVKILGDTIASYKPFCYGQRVQILSHCPAFADQILHASQVTNPDVKTLFGDQLVLSLVLSTTEQGDGYWMLVKKT